MANILDVAKCFLWLDDQNNGEEGGISNLKLQKLMYYAQGFHAALNDGKPLFNNPLLAWTHGPVVEALYHEYKQYGKNPIPVNRDFSHESVLAEEEYELISEVYETFGQYSAWKLRNMTHNEPPWLDHEADAGEIPIDEMTEYFRNRSRTPNKEFALQLKLKENMAHEIRL